MKGEPSQISITKGHQSATILSTLCMKGCLHLRRSAVHLFSPFMRVSFLSRSVPRSWSYMPVSPPCWDWPQWCHITPPSCPPPHPHCCYEAEHPSPSCYLPCPPYYRNPKSWNRTHPGIFIHIWSRCCRRVHQCYCRGCLDGLPCHPWMWIVHQRCH